MASRWLRGDRRCECLLLGPSFYLFKRIIQVPKSPTGKVLRRSLQDAHEKRQASKARL